jgi:hypothetical protein
MILVPLANSHTNWVQRFSLFYSCFLLFSSLFLCLFYLLFATYESSNLIVAKYAWSLRVNFSLGERLEEREKKKEKRLSLRCGKVLNFSKRNEMIHSLIKDHLSDFRSIAYFSLSLSSSHTSFQLNVYKNARLSNSAADRIFEIKTSCNARRFFSLV